MKRPLTILLSGTMLGGPGVKYMTGAKRFSNQQYKTILALVIFFITILISKSFSQDRSVTERITITKHDSYDFRGIEFFDLSTSHGSTLLSGDKDLELVKFLTQHNGKTLILTIEEVGK